MDIERDTNGKENKQDVAQNKSNDFKVKVAKHSDSKKLVKISKGKYEISWGFSNIGKVKGENKSLDDTNTQGLSENEKKQIVKNTSSQIDFYNAYENIELQYNIIGRKLKENFIITKKTTVPQIQFQIEMKNLTYKLNENNTITFFDELTNEKVFEIEPPLMYDAAGEVSTNVKFTVAEERGANKGNKKNSLNLTMELDSEWINSDARVYPITIDPTVGTSLNTNKRYFLNCSNASVNNIKSSPESN